MRFAAPESCHDRVLIMNVCFVCSEYPPGSHGGIGTFTQVLGRGLVREGHGVRVIGTYEPGSAQVADERDRGVRVWRLPEPSGRLGWVKARHTLFTTVAAWARRREIDIVEVPDWMGPAAMWRRLPVPVVARMNGSATFYAAELGTRVSRTHALLERSSMKRADFLCSSSRYTAERTLPLLEIGARPTAILPNPVELPRQGKGRRAPRSRNRVVFTGTLTEKKGVVSLIDAWPRVVAAFPGAELHLFGKDSGTRDGEPMPAFLRARLDEPLRESVHFHGHTARETIFDALEDAAVAVFPSHSEAFGIAPIEAMACGCPTIFSRRAAGPEVIRDGRDGLLVEPTHPADIAAAIIRVLGDQDLALRIGDAGRVRVRETFSIDVMTRRNEEFYQECLETFNRSGRS